MYRLNISDNFSSSNGNFIFTKVWAEFFRRYIDLNEIISRPEKLIEIDGKDNSMIEVINEINKHLSDFNGKVDQTERNYIQFDSKNDALFFILCMSGNND